MSPGHDFYSHADQSLNDGDFNGGVETQTEAVVTEAKKTVGTGKARIPLSLGRKVAYGGGGLVLALFGLFYLQDMHKPVHRIYPVSTPAQQVAATPGAAGNEGLPAQEPNGTIMGSGANPPEATLMAGATNTPVTPVVAAASANAVDATHASVPPPPAATQAAATPASTAVVKPTMVSAAVASNPLEQAAGKADTASASAKEEATDKKLLGRVAELEEKVARLVHQGPVGKSVKRAQAMPKSQVTKADPSESFAQPVSTLRETSQVVPPPAVAGGSPAPSVDKVRILGGVSKAGASIALVEFAGVKQRAGVGDMVPGLGVVQRVTVDGGVTSIDINGVIYR